MTNIYFKNQNGCRVTIEAGEKVAEAYTELRRAEWRNEAMERYYRGRTLDTLTDDAIEYWQDKPERSLIVSSPEDEYIAIEERAERRKRIVIALSTLTERQAQVTKLLCKGKSITQIADILGVSKQSVNDIKQAIKNKIKDFL